jgi:hypothetical protein
MLDCRRVCANLPLTPADFSRLPGVVGATKGPIDTFDPTTQEMMECQELTNHALSTLPSPDQHTYVVLICISRRDSSFLESCSRAVARFLVHRAVR